MRENDQNLFYTGVNFLIMAEDKKELDSVTETIKNIGNGRMCQIETHYYQQREAMNTILPVGNRQISTMRTMLTRDIAALLPFNVQELNEKSGVCYGINQVTLISVLGIETGQWKRNGIRCPWLWKILFQQGRNAAGISGYR